MNARNRIRTDVAIVGGGIAGLWLLDVLQAQGHRTLLLERSAFGDGQTAASQGMIHGGLKYALSGVLTGASEAIAGMPDRWRQCLSGAGDVDLSAVRVLSDNYYMWANDATLGQIGSFFASKLLRARIRRLEPVEFPPAFAFPTFRGVVYELQDLVLDTTSLLETLANRHRTRTLRAEVRPEDLHVAGDGTVEAIRLEGLDVVADRYVLCAGAGTEALLRALPPAAPRMQRRPLKQVIVESRHGMPFYAHCITGLTRPEPRLTVTTHRRRDGSAVFYLGGQLATDGAARGEADQLRIAREELLRCIPWLDFGGARLATYTIDRAEPLTRGGRRPDEAFVASTANVLVCWPIKLSLVPDLGDRVLAAIRTAALVESRSGDRSHSESIRSHTESIRSHSSHTGPIDVARAPWDLP